MKVSEWGSFRDWGVDGSARVASASNPTGVFAYDLAGSPTRLTSRYQAFSVSGEVCWTADEAGLCGTPPSGSTLFGYDDNGQRTSVGSVTFGYDATGAMVAASPGASSYSYAGDGLRVAKSSGGVSTEFTWDDTAGVAQLVGDGDNFYLYGPDGLPVERIGADPSVWLAVDGTGSVVGSTDANGALVATRSYDTWGNETGRTGDPVSLGWQGQYQDTETGLYYLRHRYYDPVTAQFTTPDDEFQRSVHGPGMMTGVQRHWAGSRAVLVGAHFVARTG